MNEQEYQELRATLTNLVTRVTMLEARIANIDSNVKDLKESTVAQNEFVPVKLVVYGFVAMVLTTFGGAIIALVVVTQ